MPSTKAHLATCSLVNFSMASGARPYGPARRGSNGTFPIAKKRLLAQATILGGRGIRVLYRLYDANEALLYVGITADMPTRFNSHSSCSPWWHDVARVHVEPVPDHVDMLAAEKTVISTEKPIHNRMHSRRWQT